MFKSVTRRPSKYRPNLDLTETPPIVIIRVSRVYLSRKTIDYRKAEKSCHVNTIIIIDIKLLIKFKTLCYNKKVFAIITYHINPLYCNCPHRKHP